MSGRASHARPAAPLLDTVGGMTKPQLSAPDTAPRHAPMNTVALGALITAVIALATIANWVLPRIAPVHPAVFLGLVALAAVVLGHLGLRRSRELGGAGRGWALTGMVVGYIIFAIVAAGLLILTPAYSTTSVVIRP